MENHKLHDALHDVTKKALDIIKKTSINNPPLIPKSTWIKQSECVYVRRNIGIIRWDIVFQDLKKEIESTNEFVNLEKVIKADKYIYTHINTLVGTFIDQSYFSIDELILSTLSPFLKDINIKDFDESAFEEYYLKIEQDLYSKNIEIERLTPLHGFLTDNSKITLASDIFIVRLSDSEIKHLLDIGIRIGNINDTYGNCFIKKHLFAIKYICTLPKVIGDIKNQNIINIDEVLEQKILNILRLFKEGVVQPINTITKSRNIFSKKILYKTGIHKKHFIINNLELKDSETDNFVKFWKIYQDVEKKGIKYLSIAIERFSQANNRESTEDKIIDFLISAEALFLGSGGNDQRNLSYRLSRRAEMFIDHETEKSINIFKFMKKAYKVRSEIVHGKKPNFQINIDGNQYTRDELFHKIELYLRISLKKAIELASTNQLSKNNRIEWDKIIPQDKN